MSNVNFTALALTAFLTGCVHAQYSPAKVGQEFPARTSPEAIELLRSQTPTRKYSEIGTVSVCCGFSMDSAVETLRKKASEKGGDAILGLDVAPDGMAMATVIRYQ